MIFISSDAESRNLKEDQPQSLHKALMIVILLLENSNSLNHSKVYSIDLSYKMSLKRNTLYFQNSTNRISRQFNLFSLKEKHQLIKLMKELLFQAICLQLEVLFIGQLDYTNELKNQWIDFHSFHKLYKIERSSRMFINSILLSVTILMNSISKRLRFGSKFLNKTQIKSLTCIC